MYTKLVHAGLKFHRKRISMKKLLVCSRRKQFFFISNFEQYIFENIQHTLKSIQIRLWIYSPIDMFSQRSTYLNICFRYIISWILAVLRILHIACKILYIYFFFIFTYLQLFCKKRRQNVSSYCHSYRTLIFKSSFTEFRSKIYPFQLILY